MPKEDCKYWDKCYQKNPAHIQKYNHPKKEETDKTERCSKKEAVLGKHKLSRSQRIVEIEDPPIASGSRGVGKPRYDKGDSKEELTAVSNRYDWMAMQEKRIKLSERQEYDNLVKTNDFLRHKFLVEMPPDFYAFWKFIVQLKQGLNKEDVLVHIESQFHLSLVGPFEFLAGKFDKAKLHEPADYLRHWRFYYDPPEFQTVFVRKGTGLHYGYWRDDPQDKEGLLLARNDASANYEFEFIGGNAFEAFLYYLEKDFQGTPFTLVSVSHVHKSLSKFLQTNGIELDSLEKLRQARTAKVVCKTFHRAGIVVPFNRNNQLGYRPLIESDAELKKILKLLDTAGSSEESKDDAVITAVMDRLQPIATAATIAVDECDFGTALELGIDLFCSGYPQLHTLVSSLVVPAYSLLQRPQFVAIIKAHLERRVKSIHLSMFDYDK